MSLRRHSQKWIEAHFPDVSVTTMGEAIEDEGKLIGSNKPSGSGTFPSGKDCLVSSMRRRRRSFANGSTLAGLVGLGMNLETTAVNLRPGVVVGWRAA